MRRILLFLTGAAVLALPAAASARRQGQLVPGFLVVHKALTDSAVTGRPVATVVVQGFVLGRIAQEGAVELYHVASGANSLAPQATGVDVSRRTVTWRGLPGIEFRGSGFRFRAVGGVWRVVVHGVGVSLYAGGEGRASLHGSVSYPDSDGFYSLNGGPFVSLPSGVVTRSLGEK
jgi:hypothetical protein